MLKVYVSSHDRGKARELAAAIRAAGHAVVSTWHDSTDPDPDIRDERAWQLIVDRNFDQIDASHVLVMIATDQAVSGGKFVEAGYAAGVGTDVWVLGPWFENGMCHNFGLAEDEPTLLRELAERAAGEDDGDPDFDPVAPSVYSDSDE